MLFASPDIAWTSLGSVIGSTRAVAKRKTARIEKILTDGKRRDDGDRPHAEDAEGILDQHGPPDDDIHGVRDPPTYDRHQGAREKLGRAEGKAVGDRRDRPSHLDHGEKGDKSHPEDGEDSRAQQTLKCLTGNSLEMLPTTVSAALTKTTGKRTASISVAIPVTVAYRSG